jgi:hypothetical protein
MVLLEYKKQSRCSDEKNDGEDENADLAAADASAATVEAILALENLVPAYSTLISLFAHDSLVQKCSLQKHR